ncbi:MAG TPA: helix-turn-helix domain-containing protein [Pyrinomonadaceae bacterium]|jgi:DNA-binding HxlR family transcriptional regulator
MSFAEKKYSPIREPVKKAPTGNRVPGRRPNPVGGCPLTAALAAVGGKWKLIIIYRLAESPRHFSALRQLLPGVSQKVLTQQLRELADDGIVRRRPKGSVPAPVEYSLTEYGRSWLPLVEAVRLRGRGHLERLASQTDEPAGEP